MSVTRIGFFAVFTMLAVNVPAQDHAGHVHPTPPPATEQEGSPHVAPAPPQHAMRDMSAAEMIELMDMDDGAPVLMLSADEFEWRKGAKITEKRRLLTPAG